MLRPQCPWPYARRCEGAKSSGYSGGTLISSIGQSWCGQSKTDAGERMIPMNEETMEIVMRLRERAKGFSGTESQHYVFPACEHGHVDPTRNQTSFRTAWRNLTKAAGLADFASTTFATMQSRNWLSPKFRTKRSWRLPDMSARKCWPDIRTFGPRQEGRQSWLLSAKPGESQEGAKRGLRHNQRHKPNAMDMLSPEVIEKMVGTRRLELLTSTVSR